MCIYLGDEALMSGGGDRTFPCVASTLEGDVSAELLESSISLCFRLREYFLGACVTHSHDGTSS